MKRLLFVALAGALLTCQVQAQTQFGVMSSGVAASNADAKLMGINLVRNHVSISTGVGTKEMDASFHYITNFVWSQGAFPTDIKAYESKLRSLVSSMKVLPTYAVIENEENMNPDMVTYSQMITAAKRVFDPLGIPVLNGGVTNGLAVALAYDYYIKIGDKATASYLAKRNKKASSLAFQKGKSEVAFLSTLPDIPYFVFHYQLKDSTYGKDLTLIAAGLKEETGKEPINNELAQQDYSTATTGVMVQSAKCMKVVVLYTTTGAAGNASTFTYSMKMAASAAMK